MYNDCKTSTGTVLAGSSTMMQSLGKVRIPGPPMIHGISPWKSHTLWQNEILTIFVKTKKTSKFQI